ncbi:threonine ammonia-lyase IlvA [Brachybacterium hainanense]|uniref:L-threonine dehydratase n=1 Tax=Brachybacterium hainanense TaxID=1541174 RepID=A0ABV6RGE4_9MICO
MTSSLPLSAADVDRAAGRLAGIAVRTPVHRSARLSDIAGVPVWVKREDLQSVRSYKLRGASLLLDSLTEAERAAGVVAASAGNHAQGVAVACATLGVQGRIYVPRTTPRQKRERILSLGGDRVTLLQVGDTFDDAAEAAAEDAERTGATIVPPFDHPVTMAGQGTVVREAIEQIRSEHGHDIGTVVIPVGGGGLLAGCGVWLHEREPQMRVVAVEPAGAPSLARALEAGHPVTLSDIDRFVDGAAVRRVGDGPFEVIRAIAPIVTAVPEGAVCTEMLNMYQTDGIIAEPAGALAATAVATGVVDDSAGEILVILSGGNNDVSRYNEVVERSLVHEGLRHYFLVTFPQEPGALRRFLDTVLGPDDDIIVFDYIKRNNREEGPALVGLEIGGRENLEPLLGRMATSGMQIERIDPHGPMYRYLT